MSQTTLPLHAMSILQKTESQTTQLHGSILFKVALCNVAAALTFNF